MYSESNKICSAKLDENISRIPVFVFPNVLKFYLTAKDTHKQLLTLYNPYEFAVRFKVLCTSPSKYTVIDPDGSIGPRACVDIVIRHIAPVIANCNVADKFRIVMQNHTTKKLLGKRDIEAQLYQSEADNGSVDGEFHSLPHDNKGPDVKIVQYATQNNTASPASSANYIAIIVALVCLIALCLPTKVEKQELSQIPNYLHLTVNAKMILCFALGLVTMVLLRA